jgi:hypothetical protein
MSERTIDVGSDFSDVPSGRTNADGDFNGERFRTEHLVPALRTADRVRVLLDNTEGFGSSFLEEAFGGLIRVEGFTKAFLDDHLEVVAETQRAQRYKRKIEEYLVRAAGRVA